MQVAGEARLGQLAAALMPDQPRQAAGQPDQRRQVEAGVEAGLMAQIDQILGADIARRARCERAAAEPAERSVETPGTCFLRRQHIDQAEAARVVEMQGQA